MKPVVILLLIPVLLLAILGGGAFAWYSTAHRPVNQGGEEKLIDIKEGTSTREIGRQLQREGFIRSQLAFYVDVRLHDDILQAGVYRLSPQMSMNDIIVTMVEGKVAEHQVTVPEGWRLLEIAKLLAEKKIIKSEDFLKVAEGKEGYLFPDTYKFPLNVTADDIVEAMRVNFDTRTDDARINLKRTDIILASIIEREAKSDADRVKIAAVYLNRLKVPMRLEADPTVQYAKTLVNSSITDPWPKITTEDYRSVNSPYNTYLNDGLPPGPICNPGLASLRAVLSPASIDDLYFFHTSEGETIFSKTLEEHNTKKKQYNLAI